MVPLTSEQEEVVRRAEEERLAHRRLIEVLFAEDRKNVIKEEDIPFHGHALILSCSYSRML